MKKDILDFIDTHKLSPFSKTKTPLRNSKASILKTKEAQSLHSKLLSKLSKDFFFADTSNLWNLFAFTESEQEIKERQDFFSKNKKQIKNNFLREMKTPKKLWSPEYDIVAVTEDEDTLIKLKEMNCPAQFIVSQYDVESLKDRDIVQVINCENSSLTLEKLPQTVFIDSLDDAYLERYLETLSGWQPIINVLENEETNEEISNLIKQLKPLFDLISPQSLKVISKEEAESELEKLNSTIFAQVKNMTLSGDLLINMLNKGELPREIKQLINEALQNSILNENIVNLGIPLTLDERALDDLIRNQNLNKFSSTAEKIKKNAKEIKKIPELLKEFESQLLLFDFLSGISSYLSTNQVFPQIAEEVLIQNSINLLIENAKPISFNLNSNHRCSILTGANSGGKTTLLEHLLQLAIILQLGLSTQDQTKMPAFSEIYYFAKNKGSVSKGAFETLLTQMSEIKPGKRTLILADEIESVTEPGIAGKIISATADYFIQRGCFMVIATHLGREVQKNLPASTRIDGIEAKGLDEFNELIVDHNPVLGRLANSTPELIIEKMFKTKATDYFSHLQTKIRESKE